MFSKKHFVFILLICFYSKGFAQLIVNEVSQGPTGSQEYVELVVTGTSSCTNDCVDLRNWIIDDNNGWHASGSGVGIASGCMRFTNTSFWSCIKIGTIIVVYNEADINPALPADDISNTDGNCVLVIPANSTLLERDTVNPSPGSGPSYSGLIFSPAGRWQTVGMRNGGDAFHTVDPAQLTSPYHSVAWGDNLVSDIYFTGAASGLAYYFSNSTDNDPYNQQNWVAGIAGTDETPGAPNTAANAAWISSLNNNCLPLTNITANITGDSIICAGETTLLSSSGGTSYQWSNGATTSSITVQPAANTYYGVTVSNGSCFDTDSIFITVNNSPNVSAGNDITICTGDNATLTANGAQQYVWSTGATTASINVFPIINTDYIVTGANSNGCSDVDTVRVTVSNNLAAQINGDTIICEGESTTLTVSGGNIFLWSTGATTTSVSVSPITDTNYSVTVSSSSGCADTVSVFVTVNTLPNADAGSNQTICTGATATLTAGGGVSYVWDNGNTTSTINVQPSSPTTYYVTVTNSAACIASDSVTVNVEPLQATIAINTTDEICFQSNDGTVTVNVSPADNYNYAFSFNSNPLETNTTGTLQSLSPGNYAVTVSNIDGCSKTELFSISSANEPVVNVISTEPSCSGVADGSITVDGNFVNAAYSIDNINFQTSPTFTGLSAGTYIIYVSDSPSCNYNYSVSIDGPDSVEVIVPSEIIFIKGTTQTITLSVSSPDYTLSISPATGLSCTDCLNPIVSGLEQTTNYTATFSNNVCQIVKTFTVTVIEKEIMAFPSAFTPDGDGLNDYFRPSYTGNIGNYQLNVFNRWGELIFQTSTISLGWDGTYKGENQPIETYVWYCTYTNFLNESKLQKGNVTLIR